MLQDPGGLKRFALVGAAGFVAPRHLKAIRDAGGELVAAVDPHDAVGILDTYFPDAKFFTEVERFDRYLEKLRRGPDAAPVDYVSICSPNYLHDAHCRLALRIKADAICEKPLVINPWNLDQLIELEEEHARRIHTVLQLRLHPALLRMKEELDREPWGGRHQVTLTYVTRRGAWYDASWKGNDEKSGGVVMNIGIHFFDLLLWLFGGSSRSEVHLSSPRRSAGLLQLERATVRWFLSIDPSDLPATVREAGGYAHRSLTLDGSEIEFSEGFGDLHTAVYREIMAGRGFGISEARPAIELVHAIRHSREMSAAVKPHPFLWRGAAA